MTNITTQTIRVDLSTGKIIPTAYTHQMDTARTLVFDMYNGGLPYTMTGNTVKFAYKSPVVDGQYTVIAGSSMASGTVSGNKVTVTLPVAYTRISGVGLLTMIITPSSGTIRPVNIRLVVQKSADGDDTVSGASDFPAALDEIAENWLDENISIQIDDTLSVSGKAADAKVTGDEISELDGQIGDLKSDLSKGNLYNRGLLVLGDNRYYHDASRLIADKYISPNGSFSSYAGWSISDFIPVEPSTEYVMAYISGGVYKKSLNNYYALYDENFRFLYAPQTIAERDNITTTNKTYYLRISNVTARFSSNTIVVKKDIFDDGVQAFIPYSMRFINGDTSTEIAELQESLNSKSDSNESTLQYDNVMRSIQRIGAVGDAPHHSVKGYKDAYKVGFRILLCDLRFTSDNIPVLFHDDYINQNYHDVYDSNGQLVSTSPPLYIANLTYSQLSEYDYGLYKGEAYRGYPLMTLYDMLALCKNLGVELYIEVKAMTEAQALIACNAVKAYGLANKTSWSGTATQMGYVINNIETARVGTMPSTITDAVITAINSLKTGKNNVFVFAWDTTPLTDEIVAKLIQNDIAFEFGTLNTESAIIDYLEQGDAYYYCTGIESDSVIAGKVILENALTN